MKGGGIGRHNWSVCQIIFYTHLLKGGYYEEERVTSKYCLSFDNIIDDY